MSVQAIARRRLDPARAEALRAAGSAFAWSRLLVFAVAVVVVAIAGVDAGNERNFDQPALTHPFSGVLDSLLSPLARWDSAWYLDIAHSGYGGQSSAFFPLYPLLVRLVATVSAPGALLVSGYVVSLAALFGALYLMHRLVALELGSSELARGAVLMLALFPGALWLGAPYSESLFLLLSVGAFYAARTGRWAVAGVCAALASATRSAGIVLVVPLVILWWKSRDRRARDLGWIALAPAGLVAYSVYLAASIGDGFAYLHLQAVWFRSFAGPLGAVPDGAVAAWDGLRQILSGQRAHVYFTAAGGDPIGVGWHNLELFGFLLLAIGAVVGVLRRLPVAYGAYVVAALALPLSFPVGPEPLMSLPRFLGVLFPLFMWLALVCRTPRRRAVVFAAFGLGLAVFTARYATWHWVA
ncbi:MAG TPA: mannosyltransferase family protein [Solirubrobacteraceae bacterium]